jgi:hypothetical protein
VCVIASLDNTNNSLFIMIVVLVVNTSCRRGDN